MRFGILGPLAVWDTGGREVAVPEVKVRKLLAVLLVNRGRPVSTDELVEALWDRRLPRDPAAALQNKVWRLRRTIEDAEPGAGDLVVSQPPGYMLRSDACDIDADQFTALATRAHEAVHPGKRVALAGDALALWRGQPLAEFADDGFVQPTLARLHEQHVVAIEDQVEARLELGEHDLLVSELAVLVDRYPTRERLRATQMRALYRAGRQHEALAGYDDLRRLLADEFGIDPGADLTALHQAILEQAPALDAAQAVPPNNLPVPLTDLIGREQAMDEVCELVGQARLVTLTGTGGVGKTRLALATATQLNRQFPDGTWLVELAALDPPDDPDAAMAEVAGLIAATLDIRDHAVAGVPVTGRPVTPATRLAAALRGKRLLLVLDNCEHLVQAVAAVVGVLLQTAPHIRVLATSQEAIGLPGEVSLVVPPLDLPDTSAVQEPAELEQVGSVRLFMARARAALPGFTLDRDNAKAIAVLCNRLDGIPLALELAATRVRSIGVHDVVARLDDRFRLLNSGNRSPVPRQQTLRAMIDWSWDLLPGPERAVLRRIAVHADGCTLKAVESVCAGPDVPVEEVANHLGRLVDRSLVMMIEDAGGSRYRLLESVAAYCLERLQEAGERDEVRRRHNRYYADLVAPATALLRGHPQREWLRRLDAESSNLRTALDGAVQDGDAELALRLVNSAVWYWFLRGRLGEARRALDLALGLDGGPEQARATATAWQVGVALLTGDYPAPLEHHCRALRAAERIADPAERARSLWFLGFALSGAGELAASEELIERVLTSFRDLGDDWGVAAALSTRAIQRLIRGDLAGLQRDGERGEALFRRLGDQWGRLQTLAPLGALAEIVGDYDKANRLYQDGLRMAEEMGLWLEAGEQLTGLGNIAMLSGDHAAARQYHEKALRLSVEHSNRTGEIHATIGLGLAARREGRLDAAEAYLRQVFDWHRQDESEPGSSLILAELGFVAEQRGDVDSALDLHLRGFRAATSSGDPRAVALSLEGLAGAKTLTGQHELAAHLLGAAAEAREKAGAALPAGEAGDVERISARCREALGEDACRAALERGRRMTFAEVAALVAADHPAIALVAADHVAGHPAADPTVTTG
ncbi:MULTISPECIES: BTAD domain-containing putative transcriptional regulator [Saccharothrix]|uniref:BTAD domain-containing putative transcriptional regulator n=1 Tax=Saccharothrix TaxID=2071 RepID=UPI00093D14AC|nr:BTAD domain-containing putative transcriptional regulator [Saccharothrix sp. CB00851]